MKNIKIFEVGAEGGILTLYRTTIENKYWYFSNENSSIDEFSVSTTDSNEYSFSFVEEFIKISSRYQNILSLHPLFVHEDYKNSIIVLLKEYQLDKENFVDYQEWSKVLALNIEDFKIENPTYSMTEYLNLKEKYGSVASWALWNDDNEKDTSIIEENIGLLHSRFVGIGLNISKPVSTWSNFRGGKHDRKLRKTFNKGRLKGFYLTDFLKNVVEKNSTVIEQKIKNQELQLDSHISFFLEEMKDVKINDETEFIIFGKQTFTLFNKYLKPLFPKNNIILLKHYSARGTDKEWIKSTLEEMGFLEEFLNNEIIDENYFTNMEQESTKTYREQLIEVTNNLIEMESSLFTDTINVAMLNELTEIDTSFEIGDEYEFTLEQFENSMDQNVNKLVNLIHEIRQTVETIMNLNNIKESDL